MFRFSSASRPIAHVNTLIMMKRQIVIIIIVIICYRLILSACECSFREIIVICCAEPSQWDSENSRRRKYEPLLFAFIFRNHFFQILLSTAMLFPEIFVLISILFECIRRIQTTFDFPIVPRRHLVHIANTFTNCSISFGIDLFTRYFVNTFYLERHLAIVQLLRSCDRQQTVYKQLLNSKYEYLNEYLKLLNTNIRVYS